MSLNEREYLISDLVIDDEYGTISATASVEDASKEMKKLGVPDLVVLEEGTDKVIGVIGDFDIVKNVVADGKDPKKTTTQQAMFVIPPVTLKTPVAEAFALMQKLNANVVPVVEKEKLIGVASTYDVWNYIPEETTDDIGLIPIKDPKNGEFWFATACSILAFMLLIILPLSGIIGYFKADAASVSSMLEIASLNPGDFKFTLFEVLSPEYTYTIFDFVSDGGFWWVMVSICSIMVVLTGLLGIFSVIYASYSDMQTLRTGRLVRTLFPALFLGFELILWIFYIIALNTGPANVTISLDGIGFFLQLLGVIFLVAALFRDYLFRAESSPTSDPVEVQ